jgi:AcrR family transcriptional regulator
VTQPQAPERLTREEKKARTRSQLIDAAATVFARRGFMAASLDEVAEEAGLTKGAVYSNFAGKEELFQAVIDERVNEPMLRLAKDIDSTGTFAERAMEGARMFVDMAQQERELFLLALEHNIYVARHPELLPTFTARYREQLAMVADLITEHSKASGLPLPLPAGQMAIAVEALSQGMALQRLADPDSVPDELLGRVYALLFQLPPDG